MERKTDPTKRWRKAERERGRERMIKAKHNEGASNERRQLQTGVFR